LPTIVPESQPPKGRGGGVGRPGLSAHLKKPESNQNKNPPPPQDQTKKHGDEDIITGRVAAWPGKLEENHGNGTKSIVRWLPQSRGGGVGTAKALYFTLNGRRKKKSVYWTLGALCVSWADREGARRDGLKSVHRGGGGTEKK